MKIQFLKFTTILLIKRIHYKLVNPLSLLLSYSTICEQIIQHKPIAIAVFVFTFVYLILSQNTWQNAEFHLILPLKLMNN